VARKKYRATLFVVIPEMSGRVFVVARPLKAYGTTPCQQTKLTCNGYEAVAGVEDVRIGDACMNDSKLL